LYRKEGIYANREEVVEGGRGLSKEKGVYARRKKVIQGGKKLCKEKRVLKEGREFWREGVDFERGQGSHVFSKCAGNPLPVSCEGSCGVEGCGLRAEGGATWIFQRPVIRGRGGMVVTRMIADGRTDGQTMAAGMSVTWKHYSVRYKVTKG
jgi:hypothetical protein